ncbi:MAG TPA: hypothetical protein VMU50_20555, partial [Polyangia bacterium]|nr:hypothetical protein [Polyangia bacterium]
MASHSGVAPAQALWFVAEQTPHAPLAWQAGVAPPQSPSPPQPRQTFMDRLHTGRVPPQVVPSTQATQVPDITSHTGAPAPQAMLLPAE